MCRRCSRAMRPQLTIDIEKLIREVDTDHSGYIDYQEFAVMMKS